LEIEIINSEKNVQLIKLTDVWVRRARPTDFYLSEIEGRKFISQKTRGPLLEVIANSHEFSCSMGHKCPRLLVLYLN